MAILFRGERGVISLVGGGGKTTLMFRLARLLADAGKRVLTTTTTRILVPTAAQSPALLVADDPEIILAEAASRPRTDRQITAAARYLDDRGKLKGYAPEIIDHFAASGLFDWIIVEADGAARRPLKAPADHEPVVPSGTTILVSVAGLEVVRAPLREELVFRSGRAGEIMGLAPGEIMTETAVARLLAHPQGPTRGGPPGARRFIFLNKADDRSRRESGARIAGLLCQGGGTAVEGVIVGQTREGVLVHSYHPVGGAP